MSSSGHKFVVDEEDFEKLNCFKWHILQGKDGHLYANNGKVGLMHRFITSTKKGMVVDHINGNGLDNRKENLRVCTVTQNQGNSKIRKDNKSGYKGVY